MATQLLRSIVQHICLGPDYTVFSFPFCWTVLILTDLFHLLSEIVFKKIIVCTFSYFLVLPIQIMCIYFLCLSSPSSSETVWLRSSCIFQSPELSDHNRDVATLPVADITLGTTLPQPSTAHQVTGQPFWGDQAVMLWEYNEAYNTICSSEDGTIGRLMFFINIIKSCLCLSLPETN